MQDLFEQNPTHFLLHSNDKQIASLSQCYPSATQFFEKVIQPFCRCYFVDYEFPKSLQLVLDNWICDLFDIQLSSLLLQCIISILQQHEQYAHKKNLELLEYIPKCLQVIMEDTTTESIHTHLHCHSFLEYKVKIVQEICNCTWHRNHILQFINMFKEIPTPIPNMDIVFAKLFTCIKEEEEEENDLIVYNVFVLYSTHGKQQQQQSNPLLVLLFDYYTIHFEMFSMGMENMILLFKRDTQMMEQLKKCIEKNQYHSPFAMMILLLLCTIDYQKVKCFKLLEQMPIQCQESFFKMIYQMREEMITPILSTLSEYGFYLLSTTSTNSILGKSLLQYLFQHYSSLSLFIFDTIVNHLENISNEYIELLKELIKNNTNALLDHTMIFKCKEMIEYVSFHPKKIATQLLKALQPICNVNHDFLDYMILNLRKLSFSREEENRIVAFKGFYYIVLNHHHHHDLDFEMLQLFKKIILSSHGHQLKKQCYKNLYSIIHDKPHVKDYILNYLKQKLEKSDASIALLEHGKEPFAHLIQLICKVILPFDEEEEVMEEVEKDLVFLKQFVHNTVMKEMLLKQYKNILFSMTNNQEELSKHALFIMHGMVQVIIEYLILSNHSMSDYFELYSKGEEVLNKKFSKERNMLKKLHVPELSMEFFCKAVEQCEEVTFVTFLYESLKVKTLKKKHNSQLKKVCKLLIELGKSNEQLFKTDKKNWFDKLFSMISVQAIQFMENNDEKIQFILQLHSNVSDTTVGQSLEQQFDTMMKNISKMAEEMVNVELCNLIQYLKISNEDALIQHLIAAIGDCSHKFNEERSVRIYYSLFLNLLLKNHVTRSNTLLQIVNEIYSQNSSHCTIDVSTCKVATQFESLLGIILVECVYEYFSKQMPNQLVLENAEAMQQWFEQMTTLLSNLSNVFKMNIFTSKKGVIEYKTFKIWNHIISIVHTIAKQIIPKITVASVYKSVKQLIETVYEQVNEPMYRKCGQLLNSTSEDIRLSTHQMKLIGKCYSDNVKLLENMETQFVKLSKKTKFNFMDKIKQTQPNFQFKLILTKKEEEEEDEDNEEEE